MSIQDLIQTINTQLPDNDQQLITEGVLRGVLGDMVDTLSSELRVFNINSSDVTNNGDGTYTITVTNPLDNALAIDEDLNIYVFDGTDWTLKSSSYAAGDPRKYGAVYDGVTDCSDAINQCIQENDVVRFIGDGVALCYDSIIVKSNTHLDLDNGFTIKLADGANKTLIKNQWAEQAYFMDKNLINGAPPTFMPEVYPDYGPVFPSPNYVLGSPDENIKITGGIIDGNGNNQERQQWRYGTIGYRGVAIALVNIDGLKVEGVSIYDPCTYMLEIALVSNFLINDLHFDFPGSKPNVDGVHLHGECRRGVISNIYGRTNDDMVALNGGDSANPVSTDGNAVTPEANRTWYPFIQGRIEDVSIENIVATNSYRAIRLLSNKKIPGVSPVNETEGISGININGIYGTFRVDAILISKHLGPSKDYGLIKVENLYAKSTGDNYITIENVNIDGLVIDGLEYFPTNNTKNLIKNVGQIKNLLISNAVINTTGITVSSNTLINNTGDIGHLKLINATRVGADYSTLINKATPTEIIMSDFTSIYTNNYQVLSDAPIINWDVALGDTAEVTLGGNRTISNPTNIIGGRASLIVKQDGVGSRTLTFDGSFRWPGNTPPTLSTDANAIDVFNFISDGNFMYGEVNLGYESVSLDYYLQFNGTSDFVRATNASVFDITTGDFDMEIMYRTSSTTGKVRLIDKRGGGATQPSYALSPELGGIGPTYRNTRIEDTSGNYAGAGPGAGGSSVYHDPFLNDGNWHTVRMTWVNSTGTLTIYNDGIQTSQAVNASLIGNSISTSRIFTIGAASNDVDFFSGGLRGLRFNSETFAFDEGSGSTLTGSLGTVLNITGASWQIL